MARSPGCGWSRWVLALIATLVSLRGRGRQAEEDQLQDPRAALQAIPARVEHREKPLAAARVPRVPDRGVDRDARAEERRARTGQGHEVMREVDLLAIPDHVRAAVKVPPTVVVRCDVFTRRGLTYRVGRAEKPRRREALDPLDTEVDPVRLQLDVD